MPSPPAACPSSAMPRPNNCSRNTPRRSCARPGSRSRISASSIMAPQQMGIRTLLSYQRQQEEQADKAGVKFLAATGQSPKGMYETFKRFGDQILFSAQFADPYAQSHPMPKERIDSLAAIA